MARPNVYTNEQIIAALVECKGLVFLAAKRVGCDPDTIYNRAKRSEAVARAIKNQRGEIIDTGELKLYQAILNGEPWAIALVLKTIGKDRGYSERQELTGADGGALKHEHAGKDGGPITYESLRRLPPDELTKLYVQTLAAPEESQ